MSSRLPFTFVFAACVAALALAGCAVGDAGTTDTRSVLGTSKLAPSLAPEKAPSSRLPDRTATRRPATHGGDPGSQSAAKVRHRPRGTQHPAASASDTPSAAGPRAASTYAMVADPRGDVNAGLTRPPSYVDVTAARVVRGPRALEVRVTFADDLPRRQTAPDKTMNVASFFDVDGDGRIDYEVWGNLADNGWSPSYRYPSGARFGGDSGVAVAAYGRHLVFTFPPSDLGRARTFRWSVGSEWGTYQQISTGTTATDHAPDNGGEAFPE